MWDLPGPGLEPMSRALAGGFLRDRERKRERGRERKRERGRERGRERKRERD